MTYHLWPSGQIDLIKDFPYHKIAKEDVEEEFKKIYGKEVFPVLFPSARSAIVSTLTLVGCRRNDYVWTMPYSSHCVLSAVSLVATPCPKITDDLKGCLVFHQWGIPFYTNMSDIVIEDSADSLCISSSSLFVNDGRFEIFSLPKIIGSFIGGITLCKDKKDADGLKKIRDENDFGITQLMLKLLSNKFKICTTYWSNSEMHNGGIPKIALNNIVRSLKLRDDIINDRKDRISKIEKIFKLDYKLNDDRLPSCWPLPYLENREKILSKYHVEIGARNILANQKISNLKSSKCLPVPLHWQMDEKIFDDLLLELKSTISQK